MRSAFILVKDQLIGTDTITATAILRVTSSVGERDAPIWLGRGDAELRPGKKSDIYRSYTNNRMNGWVDDAAGNYKADGSVTYDVTGQQVSFPGGGMTHSYDGDRLRVKKVDNGVMTYYPRSSVLGGQVVAELNGSGGWNRGYVYLGGQLIAIQYVGVN